MNISEKQYALLLIDLDEKDLDEKDLNANLSRFARLVMKNKDVKKLSAVERIFYALKEKNSGRVNVNVTSAVKLSKEHAEDMKLEIGKKYVIDESKVQFNNVIDKKMIGGLKIQIGNTIVDSSIQRKLQKLSQSFN